MQHTFTTNRLVLESLTLADANFMFELLNTAEWLRFIGNRNINTLEDATAYIQKIINNTAIHYWVVNSAVTIEHFISRNSIGQGNHLVSQTNSKNQMPALLHASARRVIQSLARLDFETLEIVWDWGFGS